MLTQARLKELLHYNPDTGDFTRLKAIPNCHISVGDQAGFVIEGYRRIKIDGIGYKAHRLVWLYMYNKWPDSVIDHINGVGYDNRLCNLREASRLQNSQNIYKPSKNGTSGLLGVTYVRRLGKYRSQVRYLGIDYYLGLFKTAQEAHEAYLSKKRGLHQFFEL